jgi:hypothetical protein
MMINRFQPAMATPRFAANDGLKAIREEHQFDSLTASLLIDRLNKLHEQTP